MSRVITFSRYFPSYHPRKGQETFFVEKMWQSLFNLGLSYNEYSLEKELEVFSNPSHFITPKYHTIRAGNRWKVGDKFSPRVWSGKPYCSKQIIIAPDIEIKKIWNFEMHEINEQENGVGIYVIINGKTQNLPKTVSVNDGLKERDFYDWFNVKENKPFIGQIISWNENITY